MGSKYIVRQPIKDAAGEILGYEILYHGENQAFIGDAGAANEFAAAEQHKKPEGVLELHDLYHHASDEKNAEAV